MTSTWFTSDPHIGHALVSRLRSEAGHCPAAEHDDYLAEQWDSRVRPRDTVWVLGDLTLGNLDYCLDWFANRPGRLRLIFGNHDEGHPMHRDAFRRQHDYLDVFEYVATAQRIRIAGHDCLLSHFPYPGTSEGVDEHGRPFDDRYSQWRLPNEGKPLIHGHTHRADVLSWNRQGAWRMTPQIHVGLDAWDLAPVRLDVIEDMVSHAMNNKPNK